jgi:hypothetical protein
MKSVWISRIAIATMFVVAAMPAQAQGKSKGKGAEKKAEKTVVVTSKGEVVAVDKKTAKEIDKVARKRVTTSQAVIVTRDVLVSNGYQVVNVVPSGATQVIYYRRGNMGRGRGLGPVQKIYVVPSGDIVRFTSVPDPLLTTILRRLGM